MTVIAHFALIYKFKDWTKIEKQNSENKKMFHLTTGCTSE